jgi:hypothetical protein
MQWRDDTTLPSRGQSLKAIGKSVTAPMPVQCLQQFILHLEQLHGVRRFGIAGALDLPRRVLCARESLQLQMSFRNS